MFKSCRDTLRGAWVMSWRQRPMWGEFAVDYFACSMRIIQHTPGGPRAPLFFFQVTLLGNWGVYYFSVHHLGRITNLMRTKSRKSKEIQALKCFETLIYLKNRSETKITMPFNYKACLLSWNSCIYLFICLFLSHSHNKTLKSYKKC